MDHVKVVVPNLFIFLVVSPVSELVRLDGEDRVSYELSVVDSATARTVALAGVHRSIVNESGET